MQIEVEQQGSAGAGRTLDNPPEILKSSSRSGIRSDPRRPRGSITGALLIPTAGTIPCLEIAPCFSWELPLHFFLVFFPYSDF